MRWNKKYKKFTVPSFLFGGHFDPTVLYLTFKAEQFINYDLFKKINKKFENNKSDYTKYLDVPCHLARAFYYAKMLNLHKKKGLNILDLGSGAGYFPYAVNFLGHNCVALDLKENELYNLMKKLLNIKCHFRKILPFKHLGEIKKKFDLITSFQTLYDTTGNNNYWGNKEWTFFILMLKKKYLKPKGRFFLQMNTVQTGNLKQYKSNLKTLENLGVKKYKKEGELLLND